MSDKKTYKMAEWRDFGVSQDYILLSEAVERAKQAGLLLEHSEPEQAIKRLITVDKVVLGYAPPSHQPRLGYLVDVNTLDEWITIGNMTSGDLKKELLDARKLIRELTDELEAKESKATEQQLEKKEEETKEKRAMTCSICGGVGHTKRKCPKAQQELTEGNKEIFDVDME